MVKRFRKKPVVIEAVQWTGKNHKEISEFTPAKLMSIDVNTETLELMDLYIHTLEGTMTVSVGDYVIKGVKGEFYPCKLDIFAATYEEVENDE